MADLLELIEKRQSRRTPFDAGRPLLKEHLQEILEAARWSPTAHNMQNFEIVVVEGHKLLAALASIQGPVSELFLRENYQQLSFSEEELARKKVGILGTMFPPSWRNADAAAGRAGADESAGSSAGGEPDHGAETQRLGQSRLAAESSALLVVLYDPSRRAPASEGDCLGIMSLGCVMQNMWLTAESLGIGFQILSSFSSDHVEGKVKTILDIPAGLKIAFTARLGYPLSAPHYLRVRRNLEDFVHRDRYGNREPG